MALRVPGIVVGIRVPEIDCRPSPRVPWGRKAASIRVRTPGATLSAALLLPGGEFSGLAVHATIAAGSNQFAEIGIQPRGKHEIEVDPATLTAAGESPFSHVGFVAFPETASKPGEVEVHCGDSSERFALAPTAAVVCGILTQTCCDDAQAWKFLFLAVGTARAEDSWTAALAAATQEASLNHAFELASLPAENHVAAIFAKAHSPMDAPSATVRRCNLLLRAARTYPEGSEERAAAVELGSSVGMSCLERVLGDQEAAREKLHGVRGLADITNELLNLVEQMKLEAEEARQGCPTGRPQDDETDMTPLSRPELKGSISDLTLIFQPNDQSL